MKDISTNFLVLNGLIVVLLVIYLLWRKPNSRMRLKMSDSKPKMGLKGFMEELKDKDSTQDFENVADQAVQLNIMFNWNGHSWDAYEVLGIPAGSGLAEVKKAYQEEMAKMDEESRAFIDKAYQAILTQKS